jgi:2'-5' RNA ligase
MRMMNHWSSSPWYRGQQFYSWYLTFEDCPSLHDLAEYYDRAIAGLPVDIVPPRWLHLTLQSVGVADDVSITDVLRIGCDAQARCASMPRFEVSVERVLVHPEAVIMLVSPHESIKAVRWALRDAIAGVWGRDAVLDTESRGVGESDGFVPHITLAYSRSDGPAAPLIDAVRAVDRRSVTVPFNEAHLLLVTRDIPAYRWSPVAVATLGRTVEHPDEQAIG